MKYVYLKQILPEFQNWRFYCDHNYFS